MQALKECQKKFPPHFNEIIYILSRLDRHQAALVNMESSFVSVFSFLTLLCVVFQSLLLKEIGDVRQAVAFVEVACVCACACASVRAASTFASALASACGVVAPGVFGVVLVLLVVAIAAVLVGFCGLTNLGVNSAYRVICRETASLTQSTKQKKPNTHTRQKQIT